MLEYELKEQVRLQKRKQVMNILHQHPIIKGCDLMLLRKISKISYESDLEKAYRLWTNLLPSTPSQAIVTSIPFEEFQRVHSDVQSYLLLEGSAERLTETIKLYATRESPVGPGYIWNDKHQMSQKRTRDLDILRKKGVTISVPEEYVDTIQSNLERAVNLPLLELLKNKRIATINGFANSLMTLLIHDPYDHFFGFDLLDKYKLLPRYKDLFNRIGNPQATDVYAREGELVASIMYNNRAWLMAEEGIRPGITAVRIARILESSGSKTENQAKALNILHEEVLLDPLASTRLGYIATRVLIQLMEQRRKQGFIRDLDNNFQPIGIFPATDPEYMAFLVETSQLLAAPEAKTTRTLTNISILVEEYLRWSAHRKSEKDPRLGLPTNLTGRLRVNQKTLAPELVIRADVFTDFNIIPLSVIPDEVRQWILKNPGSAATQEYLI